MPCTHILKYTFIYIPQNPVPSNKVRGGFKVACFATTTPNANDPT